jgi:hypothetical protein
MREAFGQELSKVEKLFPGINVAGGLRDTVKIEVPKGWHGSVRGRGRGRARMVGRAAQREGSVSVAGKQ